MKKFVITAMLIGTAIVLYCCIRTGARDDLWMEDLHRKGGGHGGSRNG